jgi:predicted aspartyl protease
MSETSDPVGTFTVDVTIADHFRPEHTRTVREVIVDTGSDATWISAGILEELGIRRVKRDIIEYANGLQAIRSIGYAIVRVGKRETTDEVVFAEPGDHLLLGSRALEGLGLMVDPRGKRLVDRGPKLAMGSRRYVASAANPRRVATAAIALSSGPRPSERNFS